MGLPKAALAPILTISMTCAACAVPTRGGTAGDPDPPPGRAASAAANDPLRRRVEAYWKRREAKDLGEAYGYYCDSYKSRVSRDQFLRLTRLNRFDIRDTAVARIEDQGARAQVTISYRFLMPTISPDLVSSEATEWWARGSDRQWCKEDEPLDLPFPKSGHP